MSASRINWIAQPFAIMGLAFGKISVAFLLLRLIGPKSCWRRNFLYFSMIASFLFCALACIFTFAQCRPVQALWNPSLVASGQAKCWKPESQSSFSLFVGSELSLHAPSSSPLNLWLWGAWKFVPTQSPSPLYSHP